MLKQLNPQVRLRSPNIIKTYLSSWAGYVAVITQAVWRLRQEDPFEFEATFPCRGKPCVKTDTRSSRELLPINAQTHVCVAISHFSQTRGFHTLFLRKQGMVEKSEEQEAMLTTFPVTVSQQLEAAKVSLHGESQKVVSRQTLKVVESVTLPFC